MRDQRPYLLQALCDWIVDSGCTPHLLVDATRAEVVVPRGSVEDGRIILNISPNAVRNFSLAEEAVAFEARFAGSPMSVYVPVDAVLAIYARENGAGMAFEASAGASAGASEAASDSAAGSAGDPEDDDPPPSGGGHLRVVK